MKKALFSATLVAIAASASLCARAETCGQLDKLGVNYDALKATLSAVVPPNSPSTTPSGGLGFPMWLTLVDGSGIVCAVVNSLAAGQSVTHDIWLGSRVISAQKANTANAFSTGALALSTANLYSAVQPGGSLFGLQHSNPVDAVIAYQGDAKMFGSRSDPLVGERIGGVNVFGGGLALYKGRIKIGAIGVSGDTSCTDHVTAWKVRDALGLGGVPGGVSSNGTDQLIVGVGGFAHPSCHGVGADVTQANSDNSTQF